MTEKANPSINRPAEAFKTAGAIAYGGHGGGGFVVDGANPTDISVQDGGIVEGDLNAFAETSSGSSLDVTIDGGEAFVFGSWLAIDTDTTVTLAASTAGQTVYVGWNKSGGDDVIVGLDSAFSTASGDTDERIPLWTFDTDGSGVTATTDERSIGYSVAFEGEASFGSNGDATVAYDSANDEIDIDGADLVSSGVTVVDEDQGYIPQTSLSNDDITISAGTSLSGGGSVALGNSVTINHGDTSSQGNVSAGAGEAVTDIDLNGQGHVTNIGTTTIDHDNLNGISSSDHHSRYDDVEARSAVDNSNVSIGFADDAGNADSIDGYDVQKNGSDANGVINFKT